MDELKAMLEKVISALDNVTEEFNCGIYDELITEAKETLIKY